MFHFTYYPLLFLMIIEYHTLYFSDVLTSRVRCCFFHSLASILTAHITITASFVLLQHSTSLPFHSFQRSANLLPRRLSELHISPSGNTPRSRLSYTVSTNTCEYNDRPTLCMQVYKRHRGYQHVIFFIYFYQQTGKRLITPDIEWKSVPCKPNASRQGGGGDSCSGGVIWWLWNSMVVIDCVSVNVLEALCWGMLVNLWLRLWWWMLVEGWWRCWYQCW